MTLQKMFVGIRDSLSDVASSNDRETWEDEDDEETEQGKLSEDDKLGWEMGTITTMVQRGMEMFWQDQMKLD